MSWEMTAEYKVICVFLDRKVCVVKKIFVCCKKEICVCSRYVCAVFGERIKCLLSKVQRNWSSDLVDLSRVMYIVLKNVFCVIAIEKNCNNTRYTMCLPLSSVLSAVCCISMSA